MASSGSFNTNAVQGASLNFSWEIKSQSIQYNQTTIVWTLKFNSTQYGWVTSGAFKVTIGGTTVYQSSPRRDVWNGTTVASGEFVLDHDNNGNRSFTAYAEAGIYYYAVSSTGSGTWSLNQIPRQANLTSAPDFTDIDNPKITYNNPLGNSVSSLQACISLTGEQADINYRDIPKDGNEYIFNLTIAERDVLERNCRTSKSRNVIFFVKTVLNGTTYYSTLTRTFTVVDANPSFNVSYEDTEPNTLDITGDSSKIIQSKSYCLFHITNMQAMKGAHINTQYGGRIEIKCNGNTFTHNVTFEEEDSQSCNMSIGHINSSSNIQADVTLIDSRGYSTTKTINISMIEYNAPTAEIELKRNRNYYTESTLKVDATYSSLNNANTITIKYRTRKDTDPDYGQWTIIQNNTTTNLSLDNRYGWDVQVYIEDRLENKTYTKGVDIGMPFVFFDTKNSAVGYNCIPKTLKGIWSQNLPVDDVVYVGTIPFGGTAGYKSWGTGETGAETLIACKNYDMLSSAWVYTIPVGYEYAYRLCATGYTGFDGQATYVSFNSFDSNYIKAPYIYDNYVPTNSPNFLTTVQTKIFKESEIVLESVDSNNTMGCKIVAHNIVYGSGQSVSCEILNTWIDVFLVKLTTDLSKIGYNPPASSGT